MTSCRDHELVIFARQRPWTGSWWIEVRCRHCGEGGHRVPQRFWRRRTVEAQVDQLARYLGHDRVP